MEYRLFTEYIPSIDTIVYYDSDSSKSVEKMFPSDWFAKFDHKFQEWSAAIKHVMIFIDTYPDPLGAYRAIAEIHGKEKTKMYLCRRTALTTIIPPDSFVYLQYRQVRSRAVVHKNVLCQRCMMAGIIKTPVFDEKSGVMTITYSCICHGVCPIHRDTRIIDGCWRCKWKKCATPQCDRMLEKEGICNQCLILSRY